MDPINIHYKGYIITTDKSQLQPAEIHKWLSEESYWIKGVSYESVKGTIDNSFCIGILHNGQQIGFARLVTDYHRFGYLMDVYVIEEHRGKGLGREMMKVLISLDWVKKLQSVLLATTNAHSLYKQFGFEALVNPERMMKKGNPVIK
jgi:GNAT superfamily N-acetyltransferase